MIHESNTQHTATCSVPGLVTAAGGMSLTCKQKEELELH